VQSNLGPDAVAAIEESIAITIQRQVTPPPEPEVLPLPWVAPVPPEAPVAAEPPVAAEAPLIEPPAPDLSAPVN
jgi:hypothetical protein